MPIEKPTGLALQERDHVKDGPKLFVFGTLLSRQQSFIRAVGQLIQTRLSGRISAQRDDFSRRFGRQTFYKRVERLFENLGRAHTFHCTARASPRQQRLYCAADFNSRSPFTKL
jgi:hypothetical protein